MTQPRGFVDPAHPTHVCRLNKSLYGLRQAPRIWNQTLDSHLRTQGFKSLLSDPCLYKWEGDDITRYILIHVDDLLLATEPRDMANLKKIISNRFDTTDNGPINIYLNIQVQRIEGGYFLNQEGYIHRILEKFNMKEANHTATPMEANLQLPKLQATPAESSQLPYRELLGKLIYLTTATRPDIGYAVSYLSRFCSAYDNQHWSALKRVLRYLKGTAPYGILLSASTGINIEGHIDSDWGRDEIDRKSTSGYIFHLGGSPIIWSSKKQSTVATSSTEAEYLALTHGTKEAIHLRTLLSELGYPQSSPISMNEDNQSCIELALNPIHHARTKHLDIQLHFVRQCLSKGIITLVYRRTQDNIADILTKPLPRPQFERLRALMGVLPPSYKSN
jgi:hypothetical protein